MGAGNRLCVGARWIVPASSRSVSLVLEKQGYHPAYVEVPAMADRCYSVNLSSMDQRSSCTVVAVANDQCECEMFSGKTKYGRNGSPPDFVTMPPPWISLSCVAGTPPAGSRNCWA